MSDRKIENILRKYPCDANGIMTVGIDLLRHDLDKAFGKQHARITGKRPQRGQCCFEKPDRKGGILYCFLDKGHKPAKHKFYERGQIP
jgi:hypothetical protein